MTAPLTDSFSINSLSDCPVGPFGKYSLPRPTDGSPVAPAAGTPVTWYSYVTPPNSPASPLSPFAPFGIPKLNPISKPVTPSKSLRIPEFICAVATRSDGNEVASAPLTARP